MASHSSVASRTRAPTKKEDSFAAFFSNAEDKEKQFAGAVKKERKEIFETFGTTASSIKRDCSERKDRRRTRDYAIRWERSGRSKERKYFQRLAQKFRDNKDDADADADPKEVVWEIPSRTEPRAEVPPLPVKFFWGDEEPEQAPKSEAEKEMDKMWSEMEFYLRAGELGSSGPPVSFKTSASSLKAHQR